MKLLSLLFILIFICYLVYEDYVNHAANLQWLKDTTEKLEGE
jgi:hypothetical protein